MIGVIHRNFFHFLKSLQPRLHLFCLCSLISETFNKLLNLLNFALLVFLFSALLFNPLLTQFHIIGIIGGIIIQFSLLYLNGARGHIIQQNTVVRHQHYSSGIILQKTFQPADTLNVKMVGRFIKQKQIGPFQQQFCEFHAHLPATAEFRHGPEHLFAGKSQPF
ncbi:hypothetical protein SDC9_59708 [bioreactor metagenome]|uniref:Uncharacterized protein n=1 Tax=bioreactor metagenome TaxID=1076179 RepID=A0A644XC69_9ZZZZ